MSQTKLQIEIQKVLDKLNTLKDDISRVIQLNASNETTLEFIDRKLQLWFYEMSDQLNQSTTNSNCGTICGHNFELNKLKETLQKAEYVIQLQALSTMLSDKVSKLVADNQNNN